MKQNEVILKGGRSTESVVKIGENVHRSRSQNSEFSQELLIHLEQHGFKYSPRYLGIDGQDREILSYINGEVPIGGSLSIEQMIQCVKAMRELHDIASLSSLRKEFETVCHLDFAPWNVIFKDDNFVGIIDFDDARPGRRIDDLSYLIWTFLDLGIKETSDNQQIEQIVKLIAAYGLSEPLELTNALLKQQHRILSFRMRIVQTEKDIEKRNFSKLAIKNINKSIMWVKFNAVAINKQLLK